MYSNIIWTTESVIKLAIIVILLCILVKTLQDDNFQVEYGHFVGKINASDCEKFSNAQGGSDIVQNASPCMVRENGIDKMMKDKNMDFDPYSEYGTEGFLIENKSENMKHKNDMIIEARRAWGGHKANWVKPGLKKRRFTVKPYEHFEGCGCGCDGKKKEGFGHSWQAGGSDYGPYDEPYLYDKPKGFSNYDR